MSYMCTCALKRCLIKAITSNYSYHVFPSTGRLDRKMSTKIEMLVKWENVVSTYIILLQSVLKSNKHQQIIEIENKTFSCTYLLFMPSFFLGGRKGEWMPGYSEELKVQYLKRH